VLFAKEIFMRKKEWLAAAIIAGLSLPGCGKTPEPAAGPPAGTNLKAQGTEHSHDNWWCDEHGVPEDVCARCDPKLVGKFKAAGDWCKEHDRPDSQCFICHPERKAEFAAQYEAKYGRQPPKPAPDSSS